jgi:hypothetical protein
MAMQDHGRVTVGIDAPRRPPEQATLSLNFNGGSSSTSRHRHRRRRRRRRRQLEQPQRRPRHLGDDQGETLLLDDGSNADGLRSAGAPTSTARRQGPARRHPQPDQRRRRPGPAPARGLPLRQQRRHLGIDITGLGDLFDTYEVYIYLDADNRNSARGSSVMQVSANGQSRYLDDGQRKNFTGQHQEADATDPADAGAGNYVRLSGLSGDALNLRIDALRNHRGAKASIAGIQIVGTRTGAAPNAAAAGAARRRRDRRLRRHPRQRAAATDPVIDDLLFDDLQRSRTDGEWIIDDGSATATGIVAW